ncbi:SRPBCC family protein [Nocardia sp. NBC_01503]|uniref:SRPBCC family protein n=1 Tax=Nocardia sp. NBC_01503 TaxID=2975997 RepID=UPI002E7B7624|nr:SRPBCC family protein [Nocardia sp. NBC_01503]WTL29073.1 SRPBCC family protein [Nocardia sp. NBC_01503]
MKIDEQKLSAIPGLVRGEEVGVDEVLARCAAVTQADYTYADFYREFCTVQGFIECPPRDVFDYLADIHSLSEWTYSTRDFEPTELPDVYQGVDTLGVDTKIFAKVVANPEALTVDYHCAWDQGSDLWMIYLMRVIPAELVLNRPGSVVLWTNCKHPNYTENPYPETAPQARAGWVGDMWGIFGPGHDIELANLKTILEYRHANQLPVGPHLLG